MMSTARLTWKTVIGTVRVSGSPMRIIGATISTVHSTSKTDKNGVFSICVPCGITQLDVSHPHFYTCSTSIVLDSGGDEIINVGDIELRYRGKPRRWF